ncbi:diguanylate cyclase [Desulfospira joergensenii]|uniref:diguanylate cyclase n=1 Tax=Desulfospira joergensenii TaxID=53329 RepID=UPI0003B5A572|nr:diguanylate cyclase [Desulfospira joergensenii]
MKKQIIRHIAVTALVTLLLGGFIHWALTKNFFQKQHLDITRQLSFTRFRLENSISNCLLIVEGVSHFISSTPDLTAEKFQSYAALVFKKKNLLKNIGAAPDMVIRYVYPLKGNQAILGKDYRSLPGQWPDVRKALASGELVTSGPLKLVQGGTGLIGRAPVHVMKNGEKHLWGLVSSVIDMDRLYESAQLRTSGMSMAIRKKGNPLLAFYGDPALFLPGARAVILPVILPGAEWEMAAVPPQGWSGLPPYILAVDAFLLLFGIAVGYGGIRSIQKNHALSEIRLSLDMSQAISHLGNWSMNLKTGKLWWSDETFRIFGLDRETVTPDMELVRSMLMEDERRQVDLAVEKAINECGKYTMDHRIIRPNGEIIHVEARGSVQCGPGGTPQKFTGTLLDITPRKMAVEELKAREEQMRAMARASHDALIMIDSSDQILFWSDMAQKMFGWTADEARGRSMHRLITLPEDCKKALEGLKHFSRSGTGPVIDSVMEFTAVKKDKTTLPVERSVAAFRLGESHYAVGSLRDIKNRKKKEEELRRLATTDGLTGLFNRRRFMELVLGALKENRRYKAPFSVIMFDADKFKRVNDTFGHEAGDRVLVDIGKTVGQMMRETDFPGRLGGEEFGVGLPHTDLEGARHLAERLRAAFETSSLTTDEGRPLSYTASFGVACCRECHGAEDLMKQADDALYQAKAKGRNRVEIYTDTPREDAGE